MKKYILISIIGLLVVGGLILLFSKGTFTNNKTMICKQERVIETTNLVIKLEAEIEYNDDGIISLKHTETTDLSKTSFNTETYINNLIESSKIEDQERNKIKGVNSKTEKVDNGHKRVLEVDYDDLDEKEIEKHPNTFYSVKKIKIDEYKQKYFKDYTCINK